METQRLTVNHDQHLIVVALAIGVLNLILVALLARQRPNLNQAMVPTPTPAAMAAPLYSASDSANLTTLSANIASLESRVKALEKETKTTPTAKTKTNGVKETVLYLGTGSTTSRDWTTIDAAAITFDSADYGVIKEIRFEAASSILSGEVYTRLLNKSTGAVYYDSNLIHNKSASEWHTSPPLYLPQGRFTYAVQLRSSNNDRASLDGSRLKILTK